MKNRKKDTLISYAWSGPSRPLRKFCVSDFRQKQEYHM